MDDLLTRVHCERGWENQRTVALPRIDSKCGVIIRMESVRSWQSRVVVLSSHRHVHRYKDPLERHERQARGLANHLITLKLSLLVIPQTRQTGKSWPRDIVLNIVAIVALRGFDFIRLRQLSRPDILLLPPSRCSC